MKHILSVLVENKPGVLSRVTGMVSRRGFNIESLSVGPTEDPTMSRITIIVKADELAYEQLTKQLNKLISVFKITDLTDVAASERELGLFMAIIMLTKCAELWVFGEQITRGMAQEIRKAESRGMIIRYFTTDCEEIY